MPDWNRGPIELIKRPTRHDILLKAVTEFGIPSQEDICIEEMSELTKALLKHRRGSGTEGDILEEIADVQITLDQMRLIYGDTSGWEKAKLERLEKRLGGDAP